MTRRKHLVTGFALVLVLASVACHKHGPPPLALEECDPAGYIPCMQAEKFVSLPITDSNLFLTYSSRWTPGVSGQPGWDARSLGLGGWSIIAIQRYDKASRLLISGDGSWSLTDGVKFASGEIAVPSFDGAIAYVFDSAGRHIRTVDGHLGTDLIRISYDSAGNLAGLDGSANGQPVHISVQRDSRGVARALSGIDGGTTTLGIDDSGRLASLTDPAGNATRITWNDAGQVESLTDPTDAVTRFTYDDSHRLATTTDPDAVVQAFETKASADSLEIRASTKLGRPWSYRAEATGNGIRRTFTARDGTTTSETTDSNGAREIELADGTRFHIGAAPNPVWHMSAPNLTPVVQTRTDGVTSRREIKYNLQPQRGLPYLSAGSITTVINGQPWTQNFDPAQRTADLVDPMGRRTVLEYDERGRLLSYSIPAVPLVSYTYNAEGRRESVTVGSGKLARTTRYNYDASTGQITRTRPDGVVEKTAVDRAGRMVGKSAGDGSTTVVGYDAAGRVSQVQPPGGLNFTLGMSAAGRPTAFVPPMVEGDASIETSLYDKDGQLSAISGLGNRAIAYSYDSAERVTSSTFDQGKRTFSYDARSGLFTQASDPSGVNISYGYTGSAQTSLTWSGPIHGSTSVTLDANGRVTREAVNGSNNLDFTYDLAGNLTGVGQLSLTRDPATGLVTHTALGVIETWQEFDEYSQLIHATTTAAGKLRLDVRYTRDAFGRTKTVTETFGDGKTSKTEYSYDRADRLTAVRVNGRATETYNYDPAGNRVTLVRAGGKLQASYDDRNRLLSLGSTQYKWMPDGTLAGVVQGRGASAFIYDDFGALREASLPDGRKIRYLVDAGGRRLGREIAGKLAAGYLYRLNGSISAETDGSAKIIARLGYDDLGHLALVERGGVTYRVIPDQIGSPRMILESRTGTVVEQIAYDAWGNITQDSAPGFIPISFAGGLRDPDTGLIRFGARDYDQVTGHWTAADPIRFSSRDANLYRYAAADPVNRVDRRGLDSEDIPIPLGPPDKGITPFLPGGPGTPIGFWRRPSAGRIIPPDNSDCDPESASWIGSLGGALPPPCNDQPPDNPNGNDNPPPHSNPPLNCIGFWCFGPGFPKFCWTCVFGDTHIQIANRLYFDFQAAGEFLAAASSDGKLVIQSRQEPALGGTEITFNTAVAANINGDRVGVYAKEPSFLLVNSAAIDGADVEKRLPHGGKLQRHGATVNISWPDGTRLSVTRMGYTLNYAINPSSNSKPTFSGLLGDSRKTDELVGRDGSSLSRSDPAFQTKLYRQFGNSWRIKQSESLFRYWPGESTATFTNRSIPSREVRATSLAPEIRSKAETVCRAVGVHSQPALDDCILDVGATGMPAFAAASVAVERGTDTAAYTHGSSAAPPVSSAPISTPSAPPQSTGDQYSIKIGDTVSADHPAKGAGAILKTGQKQTYSFAAEAGDNIYVAVGPCSGTIPGFNLVKPDNGVLDGVGACRDFGPVTLPAAGTYRIVASASGTARYTFSLRTALLNQFPLKIDDSISPDHPAGAGIITQAGQRQSYSFNAQAGEVVYLGIGPCEGAVPSLDILAPDNHRLDGQMGCHDLGREVLPQRGAYRIVARTDKDPARYSFSLRSVPPDQHVAVRLPLTVSPDAPTRGAGRITAQGAQQFYDFTAAPGSRVSIEGKCSQPCPNLEIRVMKVGDTTRLGLIGLDHLNFDWKVPSGGKYTIQVRSDGYTGDYAFTASEAKP